MNAPTDRRIALGLVVQPFLAFGLGAAAAAVRLTTEPGSIQGSTTKLMLGFGIEVGVYAIGASAVAYFLILWLCERGWMTFGRALLTGVVLGNIPCALIYAGARAASDARAAVATFADWAQPMALGSFFGLAGAGLFWFIACRPTASHPNGLRRA